MLLLPSPNRHKYLYKLLDMCYIRELSMRINRLITIVKVRVDSVAIVFLSMNLTVDPH